jgi:hypothetical protein
MDLFDFGKRLFGKAHMRNGTAAADPIRHVIVLGDEAQPTRIRQRSIVRTRSSGGPYATRCRRSDAWVKDIDALCASMTEQNKEP